MVWTGKIAAAFVAAALALGAGTPAFAQGQATNSMRVGVRAIAGCRIVASPMVFIVIPPYTNVKADATATITLTCNPNLPYSIDIDTGLNANGINRRMRNVSANDYFNYDVYKDPPRSSVWGTGQTKNVAGNSGPTGIVTHTVFGRTDQINRLKAGSYNDTLTITISF